ARQLAERNALLAEQAAELEQQVEETQALAEELEQANDELLAKTAEAEEARRASEEANRTKAEFLATMSHELRTPLNAIGGYAELMAMGIHGPVNAAQLRDLDRIRRGQRHLLSIITDILNFSRIDAGQMQFAVRDVPLPPLVDEVWSMIEPQASAKGIRYECEAVHDGGPLVAHADPDRVRQILANLLVNAVKFTAPGGGIRVECTASHPAARSPRATVRVTDTGVGIPPDNLERIFEPFVQLGRALTHTVDGTGLGLAISRDLARAMGGDVTVESEPGVGSAFSLTLPTAGR
ncbi:MAG: sensor histidine kinase, partial [Gemmatimonadaceae bacterium]